MKAVFEFLNQVDLNDTSRHDNATVKGLSIALTAIPTFGWSQAKNLSQRFFSARDAAPQPIEKRLPTAGLLVHVVGSQFGDHLPDDRQEDIFARQGINIGRGTIYGWHKAREQDPKRAHHALAFISRLQEIERATRDCDAQVRQAKTDLTCRAVVVTIRSVAGGRDLSAENFDLASNRTRTQAPAGTRTRTRKG